MTLLFAQLAETLPEGMSLFRGAIPLDRQLAVLDAIERVMEQAPPFRPVMPTGAAMINSLTNCGTWGWFSDRRGYRYEEAHPETGKAWPAIPDVVLEFALEAAARAGYAFAPDACLVNIYGAEGKLGAHRDIDAQHDIIVFIFLLKDISHPHDLAHNGIFLLRNAHRDDFSLPA